MRLARFGEAALVLALVVSLASAAHSVAASQVFTVNSTADGGDSNLLDGICDDGTGHCTLRAAIEQANVSPGTDTIAFSIASGAQTIAPTSALPAIVDPVIIDGTTQPGFSGTPIIELAGMNAGAGVSGLVIAAGNSTVKGLVINRFGWAAIDIVLGDDNLVSDNFLGTGITGTSALGNKFGVTVESSGNTVGGVAPAAGNLISGNAASGVIIGGNGVNGNQVEGNLIGTDVSGKAPLANGGDGIDIIGGAQNTIGGTVAGARNVIAGNALDGVDITGPGLTTGNLVEGNLIGTDVTGTGALGNSKVGVFIAGAANNTIGGTSLPARNVISGNKAAGVFLSGPAPGNLVQGNYIGTDLTGSIALGNSGGVFIFNAPSNLIGGTAPGAGNVVSGNAGSGIELDFSGASGNQIQGNLVGTDASGSAALANSGAGIELNGAPNNLIGGTSAAARNVISGNKAAGLFLSGSATGNLVQGNYIGTDLTGSVALGNSGGVFISDAPSNLIGGAAQGAGNVVSGNAGSGIELDSSGASGNQIQGNLVGTDASGSAALGNSDGIELNGASDNLIGGTTAGTRNVISGNGSGISISVGSNGNQVQGNFVGTDVSGTAALGNGFGIAIDGGAGNTVGGTSAAAGNLISGNVGAGVMITGGVAPGNQVEGNLIGSDVTGAKALGNRGDGVQIYSGGNVVGGPGAGAGNLISGNAGSGVLISGGSASANDVQGNLIGTNDTGTGAMPNGMGGVAIVGAPGNTIGGITSGARNLISGNGEDGVLIKGSSAVGNRLQGNFIGTDITGANALGNQVQGVDLIGVANTVIGGTIPGSGNVISGNLLAAGVAIAGGSSNQVQGNFIGTDSTGNTRLANQGAGVAISNSTGNQIGGTTAAAANVISGNEQDGVLISGADNVVEGNYIGTTLHGTAALGNSGDGIDVVLAANNAIGGTAPGAANTVAFNARNGVEVNGTGATGNTIRGNAIYSNGALGIDNVSGGNTELPPPTITVATLGLLGSAFGVACKNCIVEVYSDSGDEGRIFEGATGADGSGNWSLAAMLAGPNITATATDGSGNTSEFSVPLPGQPQPIPVPGLADINVTGLTATPAPSYTTTVGQSISITLAENVTNLGPQSGSSLSEWVTGFGNSNVGARFQALSGDRCYFPNDSTLSLCGSTGSINILQFQHYIPVGVTLAETRVLVLTCLNEGNFASAFKVEEAPYGVDPNLGNNSKAMSPIQVTCLPDPPQASPTPAPQPCAAPVPWSIPAGDDDCDGFTSATESFVGTNPYLACGPDAWPADFNDDTQVNLQDIVLLKAHFNSALGEAAYSQRFDLNTDARIGLADVVVLKAFLNQSCTP